MLVSPLPSISLLNRPEFLQCFAVVLKHPAYYPLRVVRLIVRLARYIMIIEFLWLARLSRLLSGPCYQLFPRCLSLSCFRTIFQLY